MDQGAESRQLERLLWIPYLNSRYAYSDAGENPPTVVNREDFSVDYGCRYIVEKTGFHYKPEGHDQN